MIGARPKVSNVLLDVRHEVSSVHASRTNFELVKRLTLETLSNFCVDPGVTSSLLHRRITDAIESVLLSENARLSRAAAAWQRHETHPLLWR